MGHAASRSSIKRWLESSGRTPICADTGRDVSVALALGASGKTQQQPKQRYVIKLFSYVRHFYICYGNIRYLILDFIQSTRISRRCDQNNSTFASRSFRGSRSP
jgi:hypothetical protein